MCDDDSDQFQSADEGVCAVSSPHDLVGNDVTVNVNCTELVASKKTEICATTTVNFEKPTDLRFKRKKKKKPVRGFEKVRSSTCKNTKATPMDSPFIHETEGSVVSMLLPQKQDALYAQSTLFENPPVEESVNYSVKSPGTLTKVYEDVGVKPEEPSSHMNKVDQTIWSSDVLSLVASTLVRGIGDGLSTLANVTTGTIENTTLEDPLGEIELAEQRKRRIEEEEVERREVSKAWSDVWNAAWGTDEGWDVDEDIVDNTQTIHESSDSINANVAGMESSHVISEVAGLSIEDDENRDDSLTSWGWSGVSTFAQQFTSSLQNTSLKLVRDGVTVLEKIGKKTMSVIEENDPGFKYTKKFLGRSSFNDRPNLSQVIREAHERDLLVQKSSTSRTPMDRGSFTSQLELYRGLVHLEALELVSERAESQLHIRLSTYKQVFPATECEREDVLESIWKTLQLDQVEDSETAAFLTDETFKTLRDSSDSKVYGCRPTGLCNTHLQQWDVLQRSLQRLKSIYSGERLLQTLTGIWNRSNQFTENSELQELFFSTIASLAEFTSTVLEYLHKTAECTLVSNHDSNTDFFQLASMIVTVFRAAITVQGSMCSVYIQLIKSVQKTTSDKSSSACETKPLSTSASQLVANLLLECNNAQNYLQSAARLLVPVIQLAYVNTSTSHMDAYPYEYSMNH